MSLLIGSGPDLVKALSRSGPGAVQIQSRPGPDPVQIRSRPGPDPVQALSRSGPDPVQARRINGVCLCFQVPQRTTSISPALVRKNSPGNGPGLGPRAGAHLIRARYGPELSLRHLNHFLSTTDAVSVTVATLT